MSAIKGRNLFRYLMICSALAALIMTGCNQGGWKVRRMDGWTMEYTPSSRASLPLFMRAVEEGHERVVNYFQREFNREYQVRIYPDRDSMTAYWRTLWNMPDFESQCWMVGSATADGLTLLGLEVWDTQACEHDPGDTTHVVRLVAHEQVHVFHGQVSPNPGFDGMDDIGWFVEGIATLVSGQLTSQRLEGVREWLAQGKRPRNLETVWSGPHRYGLAGSLVAYVEELAGRETVYQMLSEVDEAGLLARLNMTESELLNGWENHVLRNERIP